MAFGKGGLKPAIITQSIDLNNLEPPNKIIFMVKMLNIVEENGAAVGCGWIHIRSYYEGGGYALMSKRFSEHQSWIVEY